MSRLIWINTVCIGICLGLQGWKGLEDMLVYQNTADY